MQYEIEKLEKASFFLRDLSENLHFLDDDAKKHKEADLVSHIERLILVAQYLRGVKQDTQKANFLASQI